MSAVLYRKAVLSDSIIEFYTSVLRVHCNFDVLKVLRLKGLTLLLAPLGTQYMRRVAQSDGPFASLSLTLTTSLSCWRFATLSHVGQIRPHRVIKHITEKPRVTRYASQVTMLLKPHR